MPGQVEDPAAAACRSAALRPAVSAVFELGALPEAFRAQRAARPPGKVIINVGCGTP